MCPLPPAARSGVAPDGGLSRTYLGAVLCGGESRRMGQDKAVLEVEGVAMAVRVADALRAAGADEVVAIGGDAAALGAVGLTVVPDDEPALGPLPATLTALRRGGGRPVVVLSCDLVHPNPSAIARVFGVLRAAAPDVVGAVPVVDEQPQWTHAAWRPGALDALEAARRGGATSLRRAAANLPLAWVDALTRADVADADHPRDLPGAG